MSLDTDLDFELQIFVILNFVKDGEAMLSIHPKKYQLKESDAGSDTGL